MTGNCEMRKWRCRLGRMRCLYWPVFLKTRAGSKVFNQNTFVGKEFSTLLSVKNSQQIGREWLQSAACRLGCICENFLTSTNKKETALIKLLFWNCRGDTLCIRESIWFRKLENVFSSKEKWKCIDLLSWFELLSERKATQDTHTRRRKSRGKLGMRVDENPLPRRQTKRQEIEQYSVVTVLG